MLIPCLDVDLQRARQVTLRQWELSTSMHAGGAGGDRLVAHGQARPSWAHHWGGTLCFKGEGTHAGGDDGPGSASSPGGEERPGRPTWRTELLKQDSESRASGSSQGLSQMQLLVSTSDSRNQHLWTKSPNLLSEQVLGELFMPAS
uniref:Uncharacterized protein n=1 Tax=Myotis myotis TaxID=51298 RepID=A0A7J7S270_MYOMY|nr:hypothetical protein mMyoMyo1_010095 [Myotis myotis]